MNNQNLDENSKISMEALRDAIEVMGSQAALAKAIGTAQQNISWWINESKKVPVEFVLRIESVTGVSRNRLGPGIFMDNSVHKNLYHTDCSRDQKAKASGENKKFSNQCFESSQKGNS